MPRHQVFGVMFVLAVAPAIMPAEVRGQYAQVYGGPTFTSGVGGYTADDSNIGELVVNDQGLAVGYAFLAQGSLNLGMRPIAWGPTVGVQVMQILGTDARGKSDVNGAFLLSENGAAYGRVTQYAQGHAVTDLVVRWDTVDSGPIAFTAFPGPTHPYSAIATATNGRGVIVGQAGKLFNATDFAWVPVRWEGNGTTLQALEAPDASPTSKVSGIALAVNQNGTAVGAATEYDAGGKPLPSRPVRWDPGETTGTELLTPWTGNPEAQTYAKGIADDGTIVGVVDIGTKPGQTRAIRWDPGSNVGYVLGDLSSAATRNPYAYTVAISRSAIILGLAEKRADDGSFLGFRGVRWYPGDADPQELGVLDFRSDGVANAFVHAINFSGAAVGQSDIYDANDELVGTRAVYWGPDTTVPLDLNTLIDPASGWTLQEARAISDNGWVAGYGAFDPDGSGPALPYQRPFSMQVPEPNQIASGVILGVVGSWRRARKHPAMPRRNSAFARCRAA